MAPARPASLCEPATTTRPVSVPLTPVPFGAGLPTSPDSLFEACRLALPSRRLLGGARKEARRGRRVWSEASALIWGPAAAV
jgi:hypothetical protein